MPRAKHGRLWRTTKSHGEIRGVSPLVRLQCRDSNTDGIQQEPLGFLDYAGGRSWKFA